MEVDKAVFSPAQLCRQGVLGKLLPSLLTRWQNSLSERAGVTQQQ